MKITEIPAKPKEEKTIRVAAYARVSSDKDAAFHSLEAQKAYYEDYISKNPNWTLVGIYSDNGISGTTINRPEFQRLLEDCRENKIDMIITKSITRFARNTVILLKTIRELKSLGIDVFFEKENMHSISPDGELMLTLLAIYAEEEARSASENQKWRIKKRFENGEPWVGNMLGYRLVNGQMTIVPEEAEIVKQIYDWYLSGIGPHAIASRLNKAGIPARFCDYWHPKVIYNILNNEKYAGNMLLQKTYRPDFRTKRHKTNQGEVRSYYVENSHKAIIDYDTFMAVQKELKHRKDRSPMNRKGKEATQNMFSGIITCGFCNAPHRRRIAHSGKNTRPMWICSRFFELGKIACPSQQIPEDILIDKTKEVLCEDKLTREKLLDRITGIVVTDHFHLQYKLKNGLVQDIVWRHKSRKDSWTKEMREKARQKTLQRNAKRREENEQAKENHNH